LGCAVTAQSPEAGVTPGNRLAPTTNQLYLSTPQGSAAFLCHRFSLSNDPLECVCVCARVWLGKDHKLTKTHPVSAPTTNLHNQDSNIHTSYIFKYKRATLTLTKQTIGIHSRFHGITLYEYDLYQASDLFHLHTFECSCLSSVGGEISEKPPISRSTNTFSTNFRVA